MHDKDILSQSAARLDRLRHATVRVDAHNVIGEAELWRHGIGQGFVTPRVPPERVMSAITELRPRAMRLSIQEYFSTSSGPDTYDWEPLDRYLGAFAATGADLVVSFNLKPRWLFPEIDHEIWRPTDVRAWRQIIADVVVRYSVERSWVTNWEVSQEPDIGELGGTPFKIPAPEDYWRFYLDFAEVINEVAPAVEIGGPGVAYGPMSEPLPGFVRLCAERNTRLDFVSWHLYKNSPHRHGEAVAWAREMIAQHEFAVPPRIVVSEWNRNFAPIHVLELSTDPAYAAQLAATIHEYDASGADLTFLYHAYDEPSDPADFVDSHSQGGGEFLRAAWTDRAWRLGLFEVDGEPRSRFDVWSALSRLTGSRCGAETERPLRTLATSDERGIYVMLINSSIDGGFDVVANLTLLGVTPGCMTSRHERLDGDHPRMTVLEQRNLVTSDEWPTQVLCPADSITLISLTRS